jgi:hypothetical protein
MICIRAVIRSSIIIVLNVPEVISAPICNSTNTNEPKRQISPRLVSLSDKSRPPRLVHHGLIIVSLRNAVTFCTLSAIRRSAGSLLPFPFEPQFRDTAGEPNRSNAHFDYAKASRGNLARNLDWPINRHAEGRVREDIKIATMLSVAP